MPIIFLFGLAFVAILIAHAFSRAAKADEAWKEASGRLKLRYVSKGKFGKRTMTGKVDGYSAYCEAEKERKGKNSSIVTRYKLTFRKQRHDYKLTRAKALSAVAEFFGSQDIEIGSAEFDKGVVVQSERPDHVKKFLTPDRQKHVMRVLMSYPGAVVSNGKVQWKQRGLATSAAQIEGVFRRFVKLAESLSREGIVVEEEGVMADPPSLQAKIAREELERARGRELTAALVANQETKRHVDPRPVHELKPVFEPPTPEPIERFESVKPTSLPDEVVLPATESRPEPEPEPKPEPKPLPPPPPRAPLIAPRVESAAETRVSETNARDDVSIGTTDFELAAPFVLAETTLGSGQEPPPSEPTSDVPADAEEAPVHSLASRDVCEHLFAGNQLGMEVTKNFEEHYAGKRVHWSGKLDRIDSYYSDFVFGSGPGAKATVELFDLDGESYGNRTAIAVVQLTEAEAKALDNSRGETIEFEGKLMRCEPYMRTVFVGKI